MNRHHGLGLVLLGCAACFDPNPGGPLTGGASTTTDTTSSSLPPPGTDDTVGDGQGTVTTAGDSSETAATPPSCGNGIVDPGEVCDDGDNLGDYGGCDPDCQAFGPRCGDLVVDRDQGEVCDDGNNDDGDDCSGDCTQAVACKNERDTDLLDAVIVDENGSDSASCGSVTAPCQTITIGLNRALSLGRSVIVVAAGTYTSTVPVRAGLTIEGGWQRAGQTYVPQCGPLASELTTIIAPADASTSIDAIDIGGTARLEFLSVLTKPDRFVEPSESLYGIRALGTSTELILNEVIVQSGTAGSGNDGLTGDDGAAGDGVCLPGNGANGSVVDDGAPGQPSYSPTGFNPGSGAAGADGQDGANGTQGDASGDSQRCEVLFESPCRCGSQTITPSRGQGGCGGEGGEGGGAGGGGGASIAMFVYNATVIINGGSLTAGDGGDGGEGAAGGDGASGAPGSQDTASCPTVCVDDDCSQGCGTSSDCRVGASTTLFGSAGGRGGQGSDGGRGGSGAGGDSYAYIANAGATLNINRTTLAFGSPGQGGTGASSGTAGETPAN